MKRNDIYALLTEAINVSNTQVWMLSQEQLEQFAALVAAAEREACALIAESYEPTCESCPSGVANAIRHRGIKDDRDTESN